MTIIELVAKEARPERRKIIAAALTSGIANAIVLAMINQVTQEGSRGANAQFLTLFVFAVVLYIVGARANYHRTTTVLERALHRIRTRVVEKVERADMEKLERIGAAEIYDRITDNVAVISESAGRLAFFLQSLCIIAASTLYLASISLPAFVLIALLIVGGFTLYASRNQEISAYFIRAAQTRLTFFNQLTDLLEGFKEVKFSRRRGRELREDMVQTSGALRDDTKKANALLDDNFIFGTCVLFAALGAVVFILPLRIESLGESQQKLIAGILFVWGPLGGCTGGLPAYLRSNVALSAIDDLERKLDEALEAGGGKATEDPWQGRLATALEAHEIRYSYGDGGDGGDGKAAFRIGPMSLRIAAGETVFIVGGNGSGKSTFLKNLTGLYRPRFGSLSVDGVPVTEANVAAYRELFSAIYSDFHLFSKVYGLTGVAEPKVHALIEQMQLQHKTSFAGDRFTRRDLSTGQRKRLAMIVTLLEDRPICVFDEWAADQDPEFRKYFYEELLPSLKQRGKTVLAVSHDDRYFHCADRVITLEYGKIRAIEPGSGSAFKPPATHSATKPGA
ncbi:cyclic peptide export ABC transporter [Chondromyces apiculatus]|uniref:Putative COMPOSITE ATP-BINDING TRANSMEMBRANE ABC TRANSPORTER PROTEIN n=1 Tax=Chondromyces apiculatus DSM 436 TaxID=1192034 RepID=A0A017T7P3_9BACT|nr:cyclic peptide export ABC transporter [Chondromyces apiculatus]EYF04581.1 putative COMPOSITE ATP-BINDING TRANSMEMBRANE ABC TRANSPORTER PROTEIN [Chondromyces apiculatus DSM 436]